jgi:uncharacterized membrane protein (DUF485 family)
MERAEMVEKHDPCALIEDERYARLLSRRSRFSWTLTAIMLAIYFGYILLIAFRREILAQPLGGGVTTVGIPVGIGVIVAGIVLVAIYVRRANREFDPLLEALRKEYGA